MCKILKIELKRGFQNKFFLLSLCIAAILAGWYAMDSLPLAVEKNAVFGNNLYYDDFLEVSFTNWLGTNNMYLQQNIFYLILPFLAVLPYGGSFYTDISSGYLKNIAVRVKKADYFIAKYIAVFLSGGAAAAAPLVLSFLLSSACLPSMRPEASYLFTNIISSDKWADIFFSCPFGYVGIYTGLVFLFGGLLACMALTVTYFSFKSFLPMLFPFFVYLFSSLFCELTGLDHFSVRKILETGEFGTIFSIAIMAGLFFLLSFVPYYTVGKVSDV